MAKEVKKKKAVRKLHIPVIGYNDERENFVDNLLMLLAAGMDILAALEAVKEETKTRFMAKFITSLSEDIESGTPLYKALEGTGLFNTQSLSLLRLGERSGRLVENLQVIALQQQKNRDFKSKIRSAMMYPVFVLFIALVVGLTVSWFIMPKIATVFASMSIDLPLITRIMIYLGKFIGEYGFIAIPGTLAAIILATYFLFFFRFTRFIGQYFLLSLPGTGQLVRQTELARFGFILGTLLEAGLPLIDAMGALVESAQVAAYKKFYKQMLAEIEDGRSLNTIFASVRGSKFLFPATVRQLVSAGEKSGNLSSTLLKIGVTYENKMDITAKNLSILLEPVLLFIVWLAVLGVAIAIIMPIYGLVGSLKQ